MSSIESGELRLAQHSSEEPASSSARTGLCLITVLLGLAATAFYSREAIFSGFHYIAGDIGDNRFVISILEHWLAVFQGLAGFRSPNFFWPVKGLLGYSESMFLLFPPYAVARRLGFDPFVSFQLTIIFFKLVGYFSVFWFLRSCLRVGLGSAWLGAVLFTISNLYFIANGHAHFVILTCVPLNAGLICLAWRWAEAGKVRSASVIFASVGVWFGLTFFTSFYIGWFAVFAGGLAGSIALLIRILQAQSFSPVMNWARRALRIKVPLLFGAAAFLLALIPLFATYLPPLIKTGGRSYEENLLYSAEPIDLLNIGANNWMWGRAVQKVFLHFTRAPMPVGELCDGWPPLILVVCAIGLVVGLLRCKREKVSGSTLLMVACGIAFWVGWLLSIKFGDRSLWWIVYKLVPGGSGIRAPARFNLILNILLISMVCLLLDGLWKRHRILFCALGVLLVAEHINLGKTSFIQREQEKAILARVSQPPSICRSFFLSRAAAEDRPWYGNQIDAILLARKLNLPTINGYSGWFPPEWHLQQISNSYLAHVREWATARGVANGLCALDLRTGTWSAYDVWAPVEYALGSVIDFQKEYDNAANYEITGWGEEEDGGTWTVGRRSVLRARLRDVPKTDLTLLFRAHAFLVPKRKAFQETVLVNGQEVANWTVNQVNIEKEISVPRAIVPSRSIQIEFIDHEPVSPLEAGVSADPRKLGLAMELLKIKPKERSRDVYVMGDPMDFSWGGNAGRFQKEGWGALEPGGCWTLGKLSVLEIKLDRKPASDLALTFKAHTFIVPQRPNFEESILVNGKEVAGWIVNGPRAEKEILLPRWLVASGELRVEFVNHDPKSPAMVGAGGDRRELGLAMETLTISPAQQGPRN